MSDNQHVTLRDFVERIFEERQAALELAFKAQQEALGLASRTLELRLEKLNDLRAEVTRDRGQYITRAQYDSDQRESRTWRDRADGAISLVRFLGVAGAGALAVEVLRITGWIK